MFHVSFLFDIYPMLLRVSMFEANSLKLPAIDAFRGDLEVGLIKSPCSLSVAARFKNPF
jgi:hypothetical protein